MNSFSSPLLLIPTSTASAGPCDFTFKNVSSLLTCSTTCWVQAHRSPLPCRLRPPWLGSAHPVSPAPPTLLQSCPQETRVFAPLLKHVEDVHPLEIVDPHSAFILNLSSTHRLQPPCNCPEHTRDAADDNGGRGDTGPISCWLNGGGCRAPARRVADFCSCFVLCSSIPCPGPGPVGADRRPQQQQSLAPQGEQTLYEPSPCLALAEGAPAA